MESKAKLKIEKLLNVKSEEIKNFKRFNQGMSNYNYYFEVNNLKYVIRLSGMSAYKFVNYENEYNATKVLEEHSITSELLYFNTETGTKLSKYIEGLTIVDVDNKLINTLKKLHDIKVDNIDDYNLVHRLNLYESYNDKNAIPDIYFEIKNWWLKLYKEKYENEPKVLCHNDLQSINIIDSGDKTLLIDLEYVAYNDIFYEYASFWNDPFYLFEKYNNRKPSDNEIEHINFFIIYQSMQWFNVALYKDKIGFSKETNYDFKDLSNYFLNNAKSIYEKMIKG